MTGKRKKMGYKDLDSYKEIMELDVVDDITDVYKSRKESIAFQPKGQNALNPEDGDRRYVIQKSGYIRYPIYIDRTNRGGSATWNMNGRIIEKFEKNSEDYERIGLSLLLYYLLNKSGKMSQDELYKRKLLADSHNYVVLLFSNYEVSSFRKVIYNEAYEKLMRNFNKNKWKAVNIFLKEII